jgi:hypothetical protein
VFTGGPPVQRQKSPTALILRDWMPFALGATITAGVAPLLFIQILYKQSFYTANLLLFHRWMSIVPVLILGFYLLYILKSRSIGEWPAAVRALVGVGAFICIAFTGYSWTENHLLGGRAETWPGFYAAGRIVYFHPELLPRLAVWFFGAIPNGMAMISWQLRFQARRDGALPAREPRRAAVLSLTGLALAAAAGIGYFLAMDENARAAVTGAPVLPYLLIGLLALAAETAGWVLQLRATRIAGTSLGLITAGALVAVLCASVLREEIRLVRVDVQALYEQHARAAEVGGFWVFLLFLVVNAGLIGWCVRLVGRARKVDSTGTTS